MNHSHTLRSDLVLRMADAMTKRAGWLDDVSKYLADSPNAQHALMGAAVGGIGGGVHGAMTGQGAMRNAVIGALLGGAGGYAVPQMFGAGKPPAVIPAAKPVKGAELPAYLTIPKHMQGPAYTIPRLQSKQVRHYDVMDPLRARRTPFDFRSQPPSALGDTTAARFDPWHIPQTPAPLPHGFDGLLYDAGHLTRGAVAAPGAINDALMSPARAGAEGLTTNAPRWWNAWRQGYNSNP